MGLAIALTAILDKIAKSVTLDFNFLNIVDMKEVHLHLKCK